MFQSSTSPPGPVTLTVPGLVWGGGRAVHSWTQCWLRAGAAFLAAALVLLPCRAFALEVPPLAGRVNDKAGVLSSGEAQSLEQRLAGYEQQTGHQFVLLTMPSLEGEDIAGFSIRVAEKWALGQKQKDDGVLLLVAVSDRRMRIEVGYGLEPNIPDVLAGRIIRNVMAPHFRQNDYAGGINAAFDALMKAASGQEPAIALKAKPKKADWHGLAWPLLWLVIFLIVGMTRGRRRGGFVFLPPMGGYGGHRGGGFGGGGFGGGGGGFGGGGASGNW